ncbi:MAG: glycosyltransferase family 39 protein, partial [Ktedonobacterales bacterium]|nr:glycosyltransferase family 39 protein [Ktedonobacterales bacterium]
MSNAVLSPEPELSPETAQRRAVRPVRARPTPPPAPATVIPRGAHRFVTRWLPWGLGGGVGGGLVAATVFHYAYFLAQPDKPTKLFLLDSVFEVAVALGIALAAATVGVRILRQFPRGDRSRLESGLLAYGLGTGVLSLATAIIGLLHGYYFPVLLAVIAVPLVLFRADLRRVVQALIPLHPRFALADLAPRNVCESAIFTLTLAMVALIGEHLLVPFWGFDIFMYHFALPQRFLALHSLFGSPGLPQANLPYNNEMLNLLALNFRAEVGAGMLQGFFVGATCLAVYALGRRLFNRRTAWLAMAIFLAMPLVLYYTSSGLIDQQFAFMGLLVIITLLEYRATPHPAWIVLAGLLIGIGLGVKYQIVYLVGPLLIPLALWSRPSDTRAVVPWLRMIALNFAILALCAGDAFGLWAFREWAQVGNPVYPLIWGGAEWTPQRMDFYKSQFDNFGSFHHALLGKLVPIFDWFGHWGRYDYTPLPPLPAVALAAVAPVALVLPARTVAARRMRANILLLGWLALASLLLWGFVNQLVPRYVLPTFGLLAVLAAVVIDRAVRWATMRLAPRGRDQVLAIVATLTLLPGIMYAVQQRMANDPSPVYMGQQSYGAYLQATQMWPSYWRTVDFFNQQVPLTTHVLGVNIAAGYFFHDPYLTPDMNRDLIPYLHQIAPSEDAKLAWLRGHGYTYVIYDRTVSQWSQQRDPDNLLTPLVPPFEAFLNHRLLLVRSLDGT